MEELTGHKVSAILRKVGIPRARWLASSRVSGWGRWTHGVLVESVKRFDPNAGSMIRTRTGWKTDAQGHRARRGAWVNTGTWRVAWQPGEWKRTDEGDELAKALDAFRAAGYKVVPSGYEWHVFYSRDESL